MTQDLRCYDIVLVDLRDRIVGSEQGGVRPCVIIQNLMGQLHSTTTIVFPLSTKTFKNPKQPTHTILKKENGSGLSKDSVVLGEAITQIDEKRILKYIGRVISMDEKKELKRVYDANPGWNE